MFGFRSARPPTFTQLILGKYTSSNMGGIKIDNQMDQILAPQSGETATNKSSTKKR